MVLALEKEGYRTWDTCKPGTFREDGHRACCIPSWPAGIQEVFDHSAFRHIKAPILVSFTGKSLNPESIMGFHDMLSSIRSESRLASENEAALGCQRAFARMQKLSLNLREGLPEDQFLNTSKHPMLFN